MKDGAKVLETEESILMPGFHSLDLRAASETGVGPA